MDQVTLQQAPPRAGQSVALSDCIYVEADLTMKERALARLHGPDAEIQRYRAPESPIDFLSAL